MISAARTWPKLSLGADRRRFVYWLLSWVILPNIGFMALWLVGAPPRVLDILVIGFAGLLIKRMGFWFRYGLFLTAMTWTTLRFVGGLFNLNPDSLFYSLRFFAEIKPSHSLEYIVAALGILAILYIAFRLMRRDANFTSAPLIILSACMVTGLAFVDNEIGKNMRGHYMRSAPNGAPFGSAMQDSKFAVRADGNRHLLLIMVESLGVPRSNAEMDRLLFAAYKNNSAVQQKYDLKQGINPYYVSTTSGEVRELCGRWGDYYDVVERQDAGCLPATLSRKGYDTLAIHSFVGSFFDRTKWYPNIGFQKMEFKDELKAKGAEICGGVFAGVCDRDIPKQIGQRLRAADKPTFLYWLTLNTHLPMPTGLNLNVDNCERVSSKLAAEYPQICRQFALWDDIDRALISEITAADFPATDILIVGDHMPPYFDRHHRSQFDPAHVPWLYLKHKDAQ